MIVRTGIIFNRDLEKYKKGDKIKIEINGYWRNRLKDGDISIIEDEEKKEIEDKEKKEIKAKKEEKDEEKVKEKDEETMKNIEEIKGIKKRPKSFKNY